MTNYWLAKTEPEEYSWQDMLKEKVAKWDGVKNFQALKYISQMQIGDYVLIYHTGKQKSVVGTAKVVSKPYYDTITNSEQHSKNKLLVIDFEAIKSLDKPISLAQIKNMPIFDGHYIIKQPRLSIMPLSEAQYKMVIE